jgi:hypothetical protein
MPRTKRPPSEKSEKIDHAIAESFPASDPPSWTLGDSSGERPTPPPGSLVSPAPRAALSASPEADLDEGPSPAALAAQGPRAVPVTTLLLWAGGLASAAAFALSLIGRDERWGRAFGHAGVGLLLLGVANRIADARPRDARDLSGPSYH